MVELIKNSGKINRVKTFLTYSTRGLLTEVAHYFLDGVQIYVAIHQ